MTAESLLTLSQVTKRFPGCIANDHVDLDVKAGEIHALLGENGAGKSTLMKIVYGVLKPDEGEIFWQGKPVQIESPAAARRLGIGMVFQHFSLFDSLTVAENIALGLDSNPPLNRLAEEIRTIASRYSLAIDPDRHVHSLSVGERQRVEIVRCLLQDPKLLIMDEPTSVLTPQEADGLFETLRELVAEGCSVLYISHKLEEIRALCHRATILRGGKVVGFADPKASTARELAALMIGSEVGASRRGAAGNAGEPVLEITGLSFPGDQPFGIDLHDLSLTVRAGEIVGVAGVAGNGQAEFLDVLNGEALCLTADAIRINGVGVGWTGPRQRRMLGMGFVPEERLGQGAVPEMSLSENALLSSYQQKGMVSGGMISLGKAISFARDIIRTYAVRARGDMAEARSLSGGNLQKFIMGREIMQDPKLLIVAAPTWGVDAGAATAIRQALIDLRGRGAAILVISQDLDELFEITDRIAVIHHGRLSSARPTSETTIEEIGLLMGGADAAAETADVA
ncbi:MAG: ABC transporter ATP-binding protein [Rhodospirillales bacterium]